MEESKYEIGSYYGPTGHTSYVRDKETKAILYSKNFQSAELAEQDVSRLLKEYEDKK
ncbi:hypothetical protein [Paenibacillus alkalitolerans]|uniref:hypothetical protein n=1 Tax=Paenibacillus alkalitolerans TaxID=2799335 RepID=UPI0018F5A5E3|nr:hypothetical protein [Paenibacillus alkalitolerans]